MKILIVEDDKDLALLSENILRAAGHIVFKAIDATQVLPVALREKPDLILLDIHMPGGSGQDLLVKLKRSSVISHIPVIIVSAETDPSTKMRALKEGAAGYLFKPWKPNNFILDLKKLTPNLPW